MRIRKVLSVHFDLSTKMSASTATGTAQKEKRSWGRTKHREVTVVNQEKIEETLHSLAEEAAKKAEFIPDEASRNTDLQFPELMSDDALIAALKAIKVPIPVYSDGRPSRERLLYLYKTNVLPRPQRNQKRRRLRGSGISQSSEGGGTAMKADDWCVNGAQRNNIAELQRKRKLPGSEGISPAKKLSLDSPNDQGVAVSPVMPSPTLAMGTLNLQDDVQHKVHRVRRLKRPAGLLSNTKSLGNSSTGPKDNEVTSPDTLDAAKKMCLEKITWP